MPDNELSEREREILRLVATGASNKEIAQKLSISTNTVKVHLRNIFAKIGVASRTEATVYAIRGGLVQVEGAPAAKLPAINPPEPQLIVLEPAAGLPVLPADKARNEQWQRWGLSVVGMAIVLLVLVGLAGAIRQSPVVVSASPAPATARPRWQARSALPTGRSGLAAAIYENQIYVIGGETTQGPTGTVERYDPASDTWTTLASKPTAVADVSAVVVGGQIFVPGGRLDSQSAQMSDRLEVYDPRQDRWQQRAKIPEPISAYALATFEGKIYLFGGWNGTRYLDSVYEFDPDQEAWRTLTPLSAPRGYAGAAVVGDKVYVIGGYNGRDALTTNEAYLPVGNGNETPWTERAPLPAGRYGMGVTSISNIIYVIGGKGEPGVELPPMGYFQGEDKWLPFESPFSKQWTDMALISQGMYIYGLGGNLEGAPATQNMVYQALYSILIPIIR